MSNLSIKYEFRPESHLFLRVNFSSENIVQGSAEPIQYVEGNRIEYYLEHQAKKLHHENVEKKQQIPSQRSIFPLWKIGSQTVKSTVDGRYLSVVPAEADRTQIITVLHPRRAKDKPSRVKLDSFKKDVVELSVETGRKKVNVQLDLAAQEVTIY